MSSWTVEIINDVQAISVGINPAIYVGPVGPTPVLAIGTVDYGDDPFATITGTPEHPVLNLVLPRGLQGPIGETGGIGPTGERGPTGNGIASFARTSGNGAPGTIDIYTLTMTDGQTEFLSVYNGRDGLGAGDMLLSVYDTNNDGVVDRADVADALDAEARIGIAQVTDLEGTLDGKSSTSHTHTAADVGAVPTTRTVNGKALDVDVTLGAEDVGARAADWMPTASDVGAAEASHTHSGYAPKATIATGTLTVAGWTGTAAPYTQTLTIAGVPGDQSVPVHMGMAETITLAQIEAWGKAVVIGSAHAAGSVTFKALKDKPTEALPVVIKW